MIKSSFRLHSVITCIEFLEEHVSLGELILLITSSIYEKIGWVCFGCGSQLLISNFKIQVTYQPGHTTGL